MIAALYVERGGTYFKRSDVDPWDKERDAKNYAGPWPVVAHPPCGAWGNLRHLYTGEDATLAPIAVEQVRRWGGVLEHPRASKLWSFAALPMPGEPADRFGGYTVEVRQVDWGHPARKPTWLYIVGVSPAELVFPPPREPTHWISGFRGVCKRHGRTDCCAAPVGIKICSAVQRRRTPPAFADWLIGLARAARRQQLELPLQQREDE